MMKRLSISSLLMLPFLLFYSCRNQVKKIRLSAVDGAEIQKQSSNTYSKTNRSQENNEESITGDFNGDGIKEKASVRIIKEGEFQEKPWQMAVVFSDKSIPQLKFESNQDYAIIVNEGNLDSIPGDELTILEPPSNGNFYDVSPYTLKNRKWKALFEGFLAPDALVLTDENDSVKPIYKAPEDLIFKEDNTVYYYDYHGEDEDSIQYIKTKAKLY